MVTGLPRKQYHNEGWQEGAMRAVKDGFGSLGSREKWFEGYDWVMRLNPDVPRTGSRPLFPFFLGFRV